MQRHTPAVLDTFPDMANHHFGKFADVWKHLVLDEVLVDMQPTRYAETHAGSATYAMVDDAERRYGITGFLDGLTTPALTTAAFTKLVAGFVNGGPAVYPGSALQAMTLLRNNSEYLLCDKDPVSADDLRGWAERLKLSTCDVAERDGMTAVREWLSISRTPAVVHIDPFDAFSREAAGPSAIEFAAEVAEAGHRLVYWYGVDNPDERAWASNDIRSRTSAPLWWGDLMVRSLNGPLPNDGDLGVATTAGTGCGVVLANVSASLLARCESLGDALVAHYDSRPLPDGTPGRLDLATGRIS
jgi:23S rRNA A2030 N6-methylase RlmJ